MELSPSVLICDSGSTKSTWCLVTNGRRTILKTLGYNPFFIDTAGIVDSLNKELLPQLGGSINVLEVYFYGAGCSSKDKVAVVSEALKQVFPQARVEVDHDLLASARALLNRESGFAAILGTGTNSALYDGVTITHNIDSLGYFLGDEGSGTHIAKKLLRDFMRRQMPGDIHNAFSKACTLDKETILDTLYHKPLPNRFLASFASFASDNRSHPYCRELVRTCFVDFFEQLVSRYPDYQSYTFNCVGSIGFIFSDVLKEVSEVYGMQFGRVIREPIDTLVDFHVGGNSA